jgi:hypothetical protein
MTTRIVSLAALALLLSGGFNAASAQSARRLGRLEARADRQIGREQTRNFGSYPNNGYYGNNYNGYNNYGSNNGYVPGGYGYAPGGYYGPGGAGGVGTVSRPGVYDPNRGYLGYPVDDRYLGGTEPGFQSRGRGYLGVTMSETPDGIVRVSRIRPESPAMEAGLRSGDEILAVNGREIYASQDVTRMIGSHNPGDMVRLMVDRNGRNRNIEVVLGDRAEASYFGSPVAAGPRAGSNVNPGFNGQNGSGPNGYGPNGYGPNGYGPNGYGPNGYGPNNFGSNNYGPNYYPPTGRGRAPLTTRRGNGSVAPNFGNAYRAY